MNTCGKVSASQRRKWETEKWKENGLGFHEERNKYTRKDRWKVVSEGNRVIEKGGKKKPKKKGGI